MTSSSPIVLSRRGFLVVLGGATVAATAGVVLVTSREPSPLEQLFGTSLPAVARLGSRALTTGLVAGPEAVAASLPATGATFTSNGEAVTADWTDVHGFGEAAASASSAEASAGELELLDDHLLTPTELALSAYAALEAT
jgi:hypothetical protein